MTSRRWRIRAFAWMALGMGWIGGPLTLPAAQSLSPAATQYLPSTDSAWPARMVVFGSAFAGVADDVSALFADPAGLSGLDRTQLSLTSDFGTIEAYREVALAGFPLAPGNGLALGFSYLNFGALEGRDSFGNPTGSYGADQISARVGDGIRVLEGLSLGVGLDLSRESLAGTAEQVLEPELGVLIRPVPGWTLGLDYVLSGWGDWSGANVSVWKMGLSWKGTLGPDFGWLAAAGGLFQSDRTDRLQGGLELDYRSVFFARGGYEFEPDGGTPSVLSLGAGFVLADMSVDYAYLPYGDILGTTHRISLSIPLDDPAVSPHGPSAKPLPEAPRLTPPPAPPAPTPTPAVIPGPGPAPPAGPFPGPPPAPAPTAGSASATPSDSLVVQFSVPADPGAQADLLRSQGRLREALNLYRQAVQQRPRSVHLWWALGEVYGKLGYPDYAVRCYQNVILLDPSQKALADWVADYRRTHPAP